MRWRSPTSPCSKSRAIDRRSIVARIVFGESIDLSPSDSILLFNAGITILNGAFADIAANDIDLRPHYISPATVP